jgi:hypothetical protein
MGAAGRAGVRRPRLPRCCDYHHVYRKKQDIRTNGASSQHRISCQTFNIAELAIIALPIAWRLHQAAVAPPIRSSSPTIWPECILPYNRTPQVNYACSPGLSTR